MRLTAPRLLVVFSLLVFSAVLVIAADKLSDNEARAIGALRTLNTAQVTYARSFAGKGYACELAKLGEPADGSDKYSAEAAGFIDKSLRSGERYGYKFVLKCSGSPPKNDYEVTAVPQQPGGRVFCTASSDFKIREGTEAKSCVAQGKVLD